jgi:hypothetical protein
MAVRSSPAHDGGIKKGAIFMPSGENPVFIDFSLMGAMRVYSNKEIM